MERRIYTSEYRTYFTISNQAREFIGDLSEREWLDFVRQSGILDVSLATGRPPAGVAERVEGTSVGLWELRVTPRGRRGPHIRLLYVRRGNDVFIARGIRKRGPSLRRRDVDLAAREVREWRKTPGKRP